MVMVAHYSLPLANPSSVDTWTDHVKLVLWQSEAMKRTVICVVSLAWYTMSTMMMTVFSYSAMVQVRMTGRLWLDAIFMRMLSSDTCLAGLHANQWKSHRNGL